MAIIGNDIKAAKFHLENGSAIGFPTETVYGLAANILNPKAIASIFEIKNRPTFDPLIVHCHSLSQMKDYVSEIPKEVQQLIGHFSPGPITYLLKKKPIITDLITSGLPKVAIRIPKHTVALSLLETLDFPLAAPSANPFGYISPTSAKHVNDQLGNKIPYILDGGNCTIGLESTIIGFDKNRLIVYRKGGLEIESLKPFFKEIEILELSSSSPAAPGMLKSHYAPKIPLKLWNKKTDISNLKNPVFLGFNKENKKFKNNILLSKEGSLNEAAQNLFRILRELDATNFDCIYTQLLEEKGLGRAINDRLKRAAATA